MKIQNSNTFSKWMFFLLSIFIFAGASAQNTKIPTNAKIYHIQNYFSEAYLIKGNSEKLILIETGVPVAGYQDSLVNSIKKLGFKPENIALAIVTHGHGDHAGNARFLQEKYHIAIAGSKADLGKFTSGKTELSKSQDVSIWGNRLRAYSDLDYPPFTPDILVGEVSIDLIKYGIQGKIIPVKGGHTPGDLLVLIGNNLFVGNAFVGTFKAQGDGLVPDGHHVREHFFHENSILADQNVQLIAKIVKANQVTTFYPTHNGPVTSAAFTKYLKEEPLLKILSKQNTELLNEVSKGKSALQKKILSENFTFKTEDGHRYTKDGFIKAYNGNDKATIETLTAEDFRIVNSNKNSAVITYIENLKMKENEAKSYFVKENYLNIKGEWKLAQKQIIHQ